VARQRDVGDLVEIINAGRDDEAMPRHRLAPDMVG
jgi:hypothetical protein